MDAKCVDMAALERLYFEYLRLSSENQWVRISESNGSNCRARTRTHGGVWKRQRQGGSPLRANIDETVLLVVITEQGENRNQCEEQRNLFGFSHGLARRGT